MNRAERNERYKRIVENVDNLPALPTIVTKLFQTISSPDSSADDAATLIERDPALTSKMLRLANSAFYGMPRAVSSVSSAVVILGFNAIRSLVLSATLMKAFRGDSGQSLNPELFWMHSITCATGAKTLIRNLMPRKMMDPESAFCAGILHDIGKLIFMQSSPDAFSEACEYAAATRVSSVDAEAELLGVTHSEIGRTIADKWALPLDLENAIVYHHNPQDAAKAAELVTAVHLADVLAHETGSAAGEDDPPPPEWEQARQVLELSDDDYVRIRESLAGEVDKNREFFSIVSS